MESLSIVYIVESLLICAAVTWLLQLALRTYRIGKAASAFPGEKRHWWMGTTHLVSGFDEAGLAKWRQLAAKYPTSYVDWHGPFTPHVTLTHPSTVKVILNTSEPKCDNFGSKKFAKYWLGEGLLLANGAKWFRNRRLITPAFHFNILKQYVTIQNQATDTLVEILKKLSKSEEPIELYNLVTLLTFEIMLKTTMSYGANDIQTETKKQHPYLQAVRELLRLWSKRARNPLLLNDFIYYNLTEDGRQFLKHSGYVHSEDEAIIQKKVALRDEAAAVKDEAVAGGDKVKDEGANSKRHLDLLDLLLAAKDDDGRGLTLGEVRNEVDTFLFAGHDTTASAIMWSLYMLAQHHQHQVACQREVDSILQGRHDDNILWEDLSRLTTLTTCIKETLRICPPVLRIRRELSRDMVIDGRSVLAGTQVVTDIYKVHHNPTVWTDPEVYNPDRFLPENISKVDNFAFIPFSAGPRNCIGQHYALQETKVIIARILRRFNLETVPERPAEKQFQVIMKSKNGIYVRISERKLQD